MEEQVYLVLSLKEIRNLHRIAKAKAKDTGHGSKTCVILYTHVTPGYKIGPATQLSSSHVRVEGRSLWTGEPEVY